MNVIDDEDPDDWMNRNRSKKTGRILKGRSGNPKGRPPKPKGDTLPIELAEAILKIGATEFDIVNKKTGRKEKVTGIEAMLKQLVIAGANGDKSASKQYMTYAANAARTMEARNKLLSERLGAYLRSVDEGRPWKIDDNEAAFYQRLADEAGMAITIRPYQANPKIENLTPEELEGILALAKLRNKFDKRIDTLNDSDLATIARHLIYAERQYNLRR